LRRISGAGFCRRRRLAFESFNVIKPKAEIDWLNDVAELIAPGIADQRRKDRKSCHVEIVRHEQRNLVVAADVVDQCTRRRNAETFVRHKHQVVAVGEIDRLEQRVEAFFFAVKDSGDISFRADYIDAGVGKMSAHDFRGLHRAQIVANFERADSDAATGVRFFEVAAYIVNNVPIDAVVLD
jgi:hypothetical protein